jgi:hypothetical protein
MFRLNEVLNDGFFFDVQPYLRLDVSITASETFMLTHVFDPGSHQKRLEEHIGVLDVSKDTPP